MAFEQAGAQLVAVSYDAVDTLKAFSDKHQIIFPLLSDPGSKTIKAFGVYDTDGVPHPGSMLIDREGIVRTKLFQTGYKQRHTNEALLAAIRNLKSN